MPDTATRTDQDRVNDLLGTVLDLTAERDRLRAELDARTARPGLFGTVVYAAAAGIVIVAIARGAGIL